MKTQAKATSNVPDPSRAIAAADKATGAAEKAHGGPRTKATPPNSKDAGTTAGVPQPWTPPKFDPEHGAMTQVEFCARYHIDRCTFYLMRKRGDAPDVVMIGRKVLVTYKAAREWERRMEERAREEAATNAA
ncbi:hypothetical protein [Paraburkholderia sp. BR10882]|uniref:hypothetical protein n=1 Tax=unclassified Paraburkholderia TaxID=2615204 RepID=UPI0034CE5C2F